MLLLFVSYSAVGQSYLVLYKSGTEKKFAFQEGSVVRITTDDSDITFYASLDKIESEFFLSGLDTIFFKSIKAMYLPEPLEAPRGAQLVGRIMTIGGFGIVFIDIANQLIIDEPWKTNKTLWTVGLSAGSIGLLPRIIKRKKRKVKGKWKLQKRDDLI